MNESKKVHETIKETRELHPNGEKKLITLTGITTSQINQALKANNPYPARVFLRLDCVDCHNVKEICRALTPQHRKCEECVQQKCQKCDIPIFFRKVKKSKIWKKGRNLKKKQLNPWFSFLYGN